MSEELINLEKIVQSVRKDEIIQKLQQENEKLKNELAIRAKQIGVACLRHDLTHSLACGRCLEKAIEALEFYANEYNWIAPIGVNLGLTTIRWSDCELDKYVGGKLARQTLKEIKELEKWVNVQIVTQKFIQ